ncbi:nucleoside phosphorylase domain-containing protein [Aspergillus alliaceus]|uniref:Nucleoside phosphorylase domain-containing protein n=1 Tax=Petromyces alliaceus TaxID=209559 RepID=A0A5N7CJA2_PETAA|nr:nucleoside phosphorylase domain-containing protein [Aspergillus alliaceus]
MTFSHDHYTMAAAKAMLDETHISLPLPKSGHNIYTLGSISGHNVVIACLPAGVYGTISASAVVTHMVFTFPNIRFGLMVGIGGGLPSKYVDILLGDVIVSKPTATSSGVIQYDCGKTLHNGRFQHTRSLNKPPPILLKVIAQVESDCMTGKNQFSNVLFSRPQDDWLFPYTYDHIEEEPNCSKYQVMKDGRTRDSIARDLNILCFEMEATALIDEFPSLVILGIYDYSNIALVATVYTKALLRMVPFLDQNIGLKEKNTHKNHWMVPFERNRGFIVFYGLGGISKSQIALNRSIFWIPCISYKSIEQAFITEKSAGKWLLIFDNADDIDMQNHILFIIGNRVLAVKLAASNIITVSEPDKETGLRILEKLLISSNQFLQYSVAITLFKQLASLPLAITQAAAYINENEINISIYVTLLEKQESYDEACTSPRDIPQSLLPQSVSENERIKAIGVLNTYSFISRQTEVSQVTVLALQTKITGVCIILA